MTTADNIRTIIGFIAAEANTEHVPKFLPDAVLTAGAKLDNLAKLSEAALEAKIAAAKELEAKIAELEAKVAALEARPAAATRPTIGDGREMYINVAGIGYVLARDPHNQTIRLNCKGELSAVNGTQLGDEFQYFENKIVSRCSRKELKVTVEFAPHGQYLRASKIIEEWPTSAVTCIVGDDGSIVKNIVVNKDVTVKETYQGTRTSRVVRISGNVKTVTEYAGGDGYKKTVKTVTTLHPTVRRVVSEIASSYELRSPHGRWIFADGSDFVTCKGEAVDGGLSIKGSAYKFRIGNTTEIYRWVDGKLEYQKTMLRGAVKAGDLTVKVDTEVPPADDDSLDNVAQ